MMRGSAGRVLSIRIKEMGTPGHDDAPPHESESELFRFRAFPHFRMNLSSVPISSLTKRSTVMWRSYFSRSAASCAIMGDA